MANENTQPIQPKQPQPQTTQQPAQQAEPQPQTQSQATQQPQTVQAPKPENQAPPSPPKSSNSLLNPDAEKEKQKPSRLVKLINGNKGLLLAIVAVVIIALIALFALGGFGESSQYKGMIQKVQEQTEDLQKGTN